MLIWIDLETTGLEPGREQLLEIAAVLTDDDLNEVDKAASLIHWPGAANFMRAKAHPVVQKMHDENGLWAAIDEKGPDVELVQRAFEGIIGAWVQTKCGGVKPAMCGSTIAFDRAFLKVHMPRVEKLFSHRNIDVSVLRELAERWNPPVFNGRYSTNGPPAHRALADIRDSIESMRYYRSAFLKVAA